MPKQNAKTAKQSDKQLDKQTDPVLSTVVTQADAVTTKKDDAHFVVPNKPIQKSKKKRGKKPLGSKPSTPSAPSGPAPPKATETPVAEEPSEEISFEESSEASASTSTTDLSSSIGSEDALTGSKAEKKELALDGKTLEKLHKELELKKKKIQELKADERGVIRLARLPWGFEEKQLKMYFSQFGIVTDINLVRSRRTGNPKGYAYIEFLDKTVAQIVADTMNGYIMFSNILKCRVVPPEKLKKKRLFVYNPRTIVDHVEVHAQIFNQRVNKDKHLHSNANRKNKKLQELGIDFQFPVEQILPEKKVQENQ